MQDLCEEYTLSSDYVMANLHKISDVYLSQWIFLLSSHHGDSQSQVRSSEIYDVWSGTIAGFL